MPTIDFYYLTKPQDLKGITNHLLMFTCRLLEKAYYKKHEIYVIAENNMQAETLDDLLWTFRDTSFIPHSLIVPEQKIKSPILITAQPQLIPPHNDILLNLNSCITQAASNFHRILEIFTAQAIIEGLDQKHYDYYQAKNYPIKKHNI